MCRLDEPRIGPERHAASKQMVTTRASPDQRRRFFDLGQLWRSVTTAKFAKHAKPLGATRFEFSRLSRLMAGLTERSTSCCNPNYGFSRPSLLFFRPYSWRSDGVFTTRNEEEIQMLALPLGMLGFIFGMIAFSYATSATARVDRLEQRLIKAGMLEKESSTD